MRLRFAERPEPLPDADAVLAELGPVCRWCGFRARAGMRAYVEGDGSRTVACETCFDARHVLGAIILTPAESQRVPHARYADEGNEASYALVWADELNQTDLAHLARVVAACQMLIPHPADDGKAKKPAADPRAPSPAQDAAEPAGESGGGGKERGTAADLDRRRVRAVQVYKDLCARAVSSIPPLEAALCGDVLEVWKDLTEDQRDALLGGLRLLPLSFPFAALTDWVHGDGSLRPYVDGFMDPEKWRSYAPVPRNDPAAANAPPAEPALERNA